MLYGCSLLKVCFILSAIEVISLETSVKTTLLCCWLLSHFKGRAAKISTTLLLAIYSWSLRLVQPWTRTVILPVRTAFSAWFLIKWMPELAGWLGGRVFIPKLALLVFS